MNPYPTVDLPLVYIVYLVMYCKGSNLNVLVKAISLACTFVRLCRQERAWLPIPRELHDVYFVHTWNVRWRVLILELGNIVS